MERFKSKPKAKLEDFVTANNEFVARNNVESARQPDLPHRTGLILKEFTKGETELFRKTCRKHNCTIMGAAQVIAAIAVGRNILIIIGSILRGLYV